MSRAKSLVGLLCVFTRKSGRAPGYPGRPPHHRTSGSAYAGSRRSPCSHEHGDLELDLFDVSPVLFRTPRSPSGMPFLPVLIAGHHRPCGFCSTHAEITPDLPLVTGLHFIDPVAATTTASVDFSGPIKPPCSDPGRSAGTPISRGKTHLPSRLRPEGSPLLGCSLDLRRSAPCKFWALATLAASPRYVTSIRLLFVEPTLCQQLPSGAPREGFPCCSAIPFPLPGRFRTFRG